MLRDSKNGIAAIIFTLLASTGCTNMGLKAKEVEPPKATELISYISTINESLVSKTSAPSVTPFQIAEHGYSTVLSKCDAYFTVLIKANNNIQLTKADLTSLGTAAAVISTLTGATPKVIGGTAALFGLASSLTSNYEQYAFATPYPLQTYLLVKKAFSAYMASAPASSMATADQAISSVSAFAQLCSYAGISSLAQQAIAAAVPKDVNDAPSLFSITDRTQFLSHVDVLLAKPSLRLSDTDYVTLAVMAEPNIENKLFEALQNTLSNNVDKPTKTSKKAANGANIASDQLRQAAIYLNALSAGNSHYANQITTLKISQTGQGKTGLIRTMAPATSFRIPDIQIR